jgi:hypothetical protein
MRTMMRARIAVIAGVAGAGLMFALAPNAVAQDVAANAAPKVAKSGGAAAQSSLGAEQFSSANDALQALVAAAAAKDRDALAKIFGPDYQKLLSGDQVEDDKDLSDFADAAQASARLFKDGETKYTVLVGKDDWPTPVPIIAKDGKWEFDAAAGIDEVTNRRVGQNELAAIQTCRAYAVAQWEYFTTSDWDHDGVAEYAQHLISTPGLHNGLYWETAEDDVPSPLGALVAAARVDAPSGGAAGGAVATAVGAGGAVPEKAGKGGATQDGVGVLEKAPYYGYYLKVLTRQGSHAPGGKYGYVINGNMIAGYALVAYPETYGVTGVMTFIINQQGRVYQKNLGANTARIAGGMSEYDPDSSWTLVEQQ